MLTLLRVNATGQEGALRMVDRTVEGGRTTGIVEVFHAGAWGSVCDGRRMAASVLVDRSNIVPEIELVGITEARVTSLMRTGTVHSVTTR